MKDKVTDSKRSQLILKVIKSIGRMSGNVVMSSPHCTLACAKEDKGEHKDNDNQQQRHRGQVTELLTTRFSHPQTTATSWGCWEADRICATLCQSRYFYTCCRGIREMF